jgi:hypothetical protein
MAADTTLLQGEVVENPSTEKLDVEGLLASFLGALLREQTGQHTAQAQAAPKSEVIGGAQ